MMEMGESEEVSNVTGVIVGALTVNELERLIITMDDRELRETFVPILTYLLKEGKPYVHISHPLKIQIQTPPTRFGES